MGSSRSRRSATNESMLAISVDDVCGACDQILDRQWTDEPVQPLFPFRTMVNASAA
jgi:hypothetical protein